MNDGATDSDDPGGEVGDLVEQVSEADAGSLGNITRGHLAQAASLPPSLVASWYHFTLY